MFEVRQGGEAAVSSRPWRHSMHPEGATAPVYRFQAIDHDWEVGENHEGAGGVETRVSSVASSDVEARIQRLCSSLQSVLEKSRAKDRQKVRYRPVNAANLSTSRRYFPLPEEWGISEADLYLDSGGNLHGPLDVKHSSKLDCMKKSSGSFTRSSWLDNHRSRSTARSEANYQTRDSHRSRTYSESRGHVTAEIDGLLDDLDRMKHRESLNQVGMTRWSSLGTVGGEGGRYTTTLTRRHMKRGGGREPVDIYLKKPTASGLSKVDLLSVDNRGNTRASAGHSPVTLHVDSRNADREQRLMDELIETRRELQRTRSMVSEDGKRGLNYGSTLKVPVNAGSSRNINIRTDGPPPRTFSQTNIQHHSNTLRNHWSSENNLRTGSYLKQPPIYGTYSAHQENLRRRNEMNQQAEHLRSSRRMSETGYGEIYQETVSLQPIGRGIQDLEAGSNPATLPRVGSHTAVDADRMSTVSKYSIGSNVFSPPAVTVAVASPVTDHPTARTHNILHHQQNTAPRQPLRSALAAVTRHQPAAPQGREKFTRSFSAGGDNRGQYYSGTQSPVPPRQPGGRMVSEHRSRMVHNESHWCNVNGLGSSLGSLHGGSLTTGPAQTNHLAVDTIDSRHTLSHTNDLSHQWFRPHTTRDEAHQMLINKEPGRFIIRQSKSQPNSYALVVRVPVSLDDAEPVRTFLLNRVKGGDAVHLQGFELEPIFPSLSAFVHDHTIHQGALPVLLKLPMRGALSSSYLAGHSPSPARRDGTLVPDFVCDVLYLGSVDVFPLQGDSAVRRAVEQILSQANNPHKGLKKKCEATVHCASDKGLAIFDKNGARFTKKTIPANKILYCAYDPDERVFNGVELKNHGVADSQIFAIVVKKTRFTMTEHAVYVMCQLEPNQPSSSLINYINQNYTTSYRR